MKKRHEEVINEKDDEIADLKKNQEDFVKGHKKLKNQIQDLVKLIED